MVVAAEEDLWFHVDGAYGAAAAGTALVGGLFRGLDRADSVALDPHKWLFVPFGAGCVLVRDPERLRDAFSLVPEYLRQDGGRYAPMEYGFELSRRVRALKVWMTFVAYGVEALHDAIADNIRTMRHMARDREHRAHDAEDNHRGVMDPQQLQGPMSELGLGPTALSTAIATAATVASVALAVRWLDRRRLRDIGLALDRWWWRDFFAGLVLGAALVSAVVAVLVVAGWVEVTDTLVTPAGTDPAALAGLVLVVVLGVGISEELLIRPSRRLPSPDRASPPQSLRRRTCRPSLRGSR